MHNPKRCSILEQSVEVVALARPIVAGVQRRDRELASQLRRAFSSVCLNLGEGFGSSSGNARLRFETALGSLKEAQVGLRVAVAWGYVSQGAIAEVLACADCLGGRIFGLVRR